MVAAFGRPITATGRKLLPSIYPALRTVLSTLMGLDPARVDDYRTRMDTVLDQVDRRLATHRYMVGDCLSIADIGMVAASGPVLLPDHYAKWIPPLSDLPPAFVKIVEETRTRPCAAYVSRVYRELRPEQAKQI